VNNEQHNMLIRRQILSALADCSGYLLSEPVLYAQVSIMVDPTPTRAEFAAHLKYLESYSFVVGIRPELGGPVKWGISDSGRALLV